MAAEINNLITGIIEALNTWRGIYAADRMQFALVSFEDYRGRFQSCGYDDQYGGPGDLPFRVEAPIGSPDAQIFNAVLGLTASGGADLPESYSRVLWEMQQPDSGIGFRPGSARFVVLFADNIPHDCFPPEGVNCGSGLLPTTGVDIGRDGVPLTADDLDFNDSVALMVQNYTRLVTVYSGTVPDDFCAWQQWSTMMNGNSFQIRPNGSIPKDKNLRRTVTKLIGGGEYQGLTFAPQPSQLNFSFNPPSIEGYIGYGSAQAHVGGVFPFDMTITVPPNLDPTITNITTTVEVLADGARIGYQTIDVDIP